MQSIDTNQEYRDTHLKGPDFFEAEIQFSSTEFKKVDAENYKLIGNLSMKDVTKPVELAVEYGGAEKEQYGNTKHGFEISGTINRKEFGLTYNALTETGALPWEKI